MASNRSWEECVGLLKDKIVDRPVTASYLEQFRMDPNWFANPELATDIHGIAHMTRVLVLVNVLARIYPGEPVTQDELDALSGSAVTHDTQRIIHDAPDPDHGDRAGAWFFARYAYNSPHVNDHFTTFSPLAMYYTTYINTHHEPEDHVDTMSPLLAIFKDADALDRFRDPENGNFNPKYLRFAESELFVPIARELVRRSNEHIQAGVAHFDAVMVSALEMDLISTD